MLDFPGKLCQHKQPSSHPCRKSPFRRGGGEGEEKEEPLVLGSSDLPRSDPPRSAHHRDYLCSLAFLTINQLLCGRETQRGCRLPSQNVHVNYEISMIGQHQQIQVRYPLIDEMIVCVDYVHLTDHF